LYAKSLTPNRGKVTRRYEGNEGRELLLLLRGLLRKTIFWALEMIKELRTVKKRHREQQGKE
jgi:hypothetical protein